MTRRAVALALLALGLTAGAQAQTTYRWVDEHGRVQYSDQPPPPSVKRVDEKRFRSDAAQTVDSYGVRRAAESFPVTLYTSDNCTDLCARARAFLAERGVPYTEMKIATEADINAYRDRFGTPDEVPAITVGAVAIKRFEPGGWTRALDNAGYPKTPMPRQ
ncbi:glutaredoxin family protein [Azoarcus olearius]|uniref:Uncharacterized protein n=1 Tax=Azoarcus sp. (strain BH72) TaxID=418699 RepID=A1K9I9_AZOSB|nr:glutaredoxin family protein [Azoarcus olearius]ANQ86046.1 hypothetical protein dqs_3018 [Azoarcus olearius]CAL95494.1 conserved hypothetical protein [Azoarcus olearius]